MIRLLGLLYWQIAQAITISYPFPSHSRHVTTSPHVIPQSALAGPHHWSIPDTLRPLDPWWDTSLQLPKQKTSRHFCPSLLPINLLRNTNNILLTSCWQCGVDELPFGLAPFARPPRSSSGADDLSSEKTHHSPERCELLWTL